MKNNHTVTAIGVLIFQQAPGGDDSDAGSSNGYHAKVKIANHNADADVKHSADPIEQEQKVIENSSYEKDSPNTLSGPESYRSMSEILASMNSSNHFSTPGNEHGSGKQSGRDSNTNVSSKRSTFWGRSNVSLHYYLCSFKQFTNICHIYCVALFFNLYPFSHLRRLM